MINPFETFYWISFFRGIKVTLSCTCYFLKAQMIMCLHSQCAGVSNGISETGQQTFGQPPSIHIMPWLSTVYYLSIYLSVRLTDK